MQLLLKAASYFPIQTYMPCFAACWTKVSRDLLLHCPNLGFGYDQVKFDMKCSEMFLFYCVTYPYFIKRN